MMNPAWTERVSSKYSSEIQIGESPHPAEMFFDYWRGQRRDYYATRTPNPQKRRAIVTMVHNESVFLPIWLRFYSQFFAPEDLHVLDNETIDGSTDQSGFVRVPVTKGSVDHRWMVETSPNISTAFSIITMSSLSLMSMRSSFLIRPGERLASTSIASMSRSSTLSGTS